MASTSITYPLGSRRFWAAVCSRQERGIVGDQIYQPGSSVTIGAPSSSSLEKEGCGADLVVPGWSGPSLVLISEGTLLNLQPRMRVNMCDDNGEGRLVGTYEELVASGIVPPLPITGTKVMVRLSDDISLLIKCVDG